MSVLQIESVGEPFTNPELSEPAFDVLKRADAMGLLEGKVRRLTRLDRKSWDEILRILQKAGFATALPQARAASVGDLAQAVRAMNQALEDSPSPRHEWKRLPEVLGDDLLAELLGGLSPSSLRRYEAGVRPTPDDVAQRLHLLALVTADLAGAYNEAGIRQWFQRTRTQLDHRSPRQLLRRGWRADDPGPARVRDLARSLTASPAT